MGLRLIDSAHIVYSLVGLGICFALLWRGCTVEAQGAWPVWDEETKLDLGRCIMAEMDYRDTEAKRQEAAAITWVMIKRWRLQKKGWTIGEQIRRYCALFDKRSHRYWRSRSRNIRQSTPEAPLHSSKQEWQSMMTLIGNVLQRSKVSDPCPNATHWAGRTDRIPPTWTCICKFAPRGNVFCHPQR